LNNALSHVPSDSTAHSVLQQIVNTAPGPQLGQNVSQVASDGHSHAGNETPPISTPSQAQNGLSHKP
jgi:hypothetical protein